MDGKVAGTDILITSGTSATGELTARNLSFEQIFHRAGLLITEADISHFMIAAGSILISITSIMPAAVRLDWPGKGTVVFRRDMPKDG